MSKRLTITLTDEEYAALESEAQQERQIEQDKLPDDPTEVGGA